MFKKVFSWILFVLLVFHCSLPGFSKSSELDFELSDVTLKVKKILNISDNFSQFNSNVNDYTLLKNWTLKWSNNDTVITVTCDNNGKIYSYNKSDNVSSYIYKDTSNFSPIFTKESFDNSKKVAENFLKKVLDENESVSFYDFREKLPTNLPDYYYFGGVIKINGVDSPFTFSISVDSAKLEIVNFRRSGINISYVNDIPDSSSNVSETYAKSKLCGTCSFKIEYALDYSTSSKLAKLYYLPDINYNYYVDAKTGKLVDKSSLYTDTHGGNDVLLSNAKGNVENLVDDEVQLTEIELSNISKLKDVLDKEKIDTIIKSKKELGLSKYSLSNVNYATMKDSDNVYCNLTYCSTSDSESLGGIDELKIYKYINVDAKNCDIISLSTSYPYHNNDKNGNLAKKDYHKDFLKKYQNDYFSKTKLYEKTSFLANTKRETFIYAQKRNGYFFPSNNLSITVNKYTGFVDSFYKTWDDKVKFESSKNIIDLEEAKNLFFNSCDVVLSYISVPSPIDENKEIYDKLGYKYLNRLNLAFTLKNTKAIYRIHAKTGKLIGNDIENKNIFSYSDIENHPEKDKLLVLTEHGIGFEHDKLNPDKVLTQIDILVLFANALGYSFDVSSLNLNSYNDLYSIAYRYNFITPNEKNPSKVMSRFDLIKMIISASEYKSIAKLGDIFKCDFLDANEMTQNMLGYACIAKSLGLIKDDYFRPNDSETRLDACLVLYNYMIRE